MTLNTTGPISLAGATTGQSIAVELGLGTTTQISLNQAAVRTLAGVASGAIIMPTDFYGKSNFTPGNATYTSSGTFTVPTGTATLKIEIWGGGGSGGSSIFGTNPASTNNTAGGQSSVSVLSMTANGGAKGSNPGAGGAGGTAAGGTTNTTGTAGAAGGNVGSCGSPSYYYKGGTGGASPNGGSGGVASCNPFNGADGASPGAGGSGATGVDSSVEPPITEGGGGGGGGGYSTKTLTSSIAASYVYVVGAGGSKGTGATLAGGDGAVGSVKFTWS